MRRLAPISLVFWGLSASAAPRTPCSAPDLPAAIAEIARRLDATRDRGAFARLADDAAALTRDGPGAACAAYTAGSAWFFLSAAGADRRFHAARSVVHLVRAQALDAEGMAGVQPASRLREAWSRVGTVPGWLDRPAAPVSVSLPAGSGHLLLGPADEGAWKVACGATPSCDGAANFEVGLGPTQVLTLRPGRYAVRRRTACGESHQTVEVAGGPLSLPSEPPCPVTLRVLDGSEKVGKFNVLDASGEPVSGPVLASLGDVTIQAPGYRPARVGLPAAGGDATVRLERCTVDLEVVTLPADAQVDGGGRAAWGRRAVRLSRPGYDDLVAEVEVPPPARCEGDRHEVGFELARPVRVAASDDDGQAVTLSRLWIQGQAVVPTSFSRPPGQYGYQAEHPLLGTTVGSFTVPPCVTGTCGAARLDILFEGRGAGAGPWVVLSGAGVALITGAVFGVAALDTDEQIRGYTVRREESRSIADLVEARDRQATLANVGFGLGAALAVGAVVWLAAGGD